MSNTGENVVSIPLRKAEARAPRTGVLSERECSTVSAICNRVVRILGLLDRDGLHEDIAIVQNCCPIDLEALAQANEKVFVEELLHIVDATDRATGSLKANFQSRFTLNQRQRTQA